MFFSILKTGYSKAVSVKSFQNGYLQYIDSDTLMEIISRNNVLLELHFRAGEFLVEGLEIGLLYSNEKMEKEEVDKIFQQLVLRIGKESINEKNDLSDLEERSEKIIGK